MRNTEGMRTFVLDQLGDVSGLRPRAMFGGIGLYAGEVFFGILAADTLYFKVDDGNRPDYEAAGSRPFKPYADRDMKMPYYAVPADVIENRLRLTAWADHAVAAARRGKGRAPRR